MTQAGVIETDALVVGAGPVGLFQVFELGLLEIHAHVVDSLPVPGGQCIELYGDKPIYDIPGVPRCTAKELIANLQRQIKPFDAGFHMSQVVNVVRQEADERFFVETSKGVRFLAKTLFIAGGAGSFQPRRLRIEGLDAFESRQLFYRVDGPAHFKGKNVVVVGGGEAAIDAALALAKDGSDRAARITLIHRRDAFQADAARLAKLQALRDAGAIHFIAGQVTGIAQTGERLTAAHITDGEGTTHAVPVDTLLVLLGLSPKLGPIADWGLALERRQVTVDTEKFQTSTPGIFAVGDVNTYPGKKKLILSGFHEATLAAFGAAAIVYPDQRIQLEYTTTSTRLHKVLGVDSPSVE